MNHLPSDLLQLIFDRLDGINLLHIACTGKHWRDSACLVRDVRNKRAYSFLLEHVLLKFDCKHWTVAGSASLWLLLYMSGRNPVWTYDDGNVWYAGCAKLTHFHYPFTTVGNRNIIDESGSIRKSVI